MILTTVVRLLMRHLAAILLCLCIANPAAATAQTSANASSPVGQAGKRQSRTDTSRNSQPMTRIDNRLQTRIDTRFRSRLDGSGNQPENTLASFAAASKATQQTNPRNNTTASEQP